MTATLSAKTNPFTIDRTLLPVSVGPCLLDVIDQSGLTFAGPIDARICLNGKTVPRAKWETTFPQPHDLIELAIIPHGGGGDGGGKDPLRTILMLGLMIAAPMVGPAIGGWLGSTMGLGLLTTSGAGVFTGLTMAAGFLAINALCPPPSSQQITQRSGQDRASSDSYSITGSSNRIEPYAPIPLNLGRNRIWPPYAAKPYTELVGSDQYLRCLFFIGYAPNAIGGLLIGETSIENYEDIEFYVYEDFDPSSDTLQFWSQTVDEIDLGGGIELLQADGWTERTTETGADEVSVDLTLPLGLVEFNSDGSRSALILEYEIQWSPKDADTWSIGASGQSFSQRSVLDSGTNYQYRYDRIVMDRSDGSLHLLIGQDATYIFTGEYPGAPGEWYCVPPGIPSWAMPVCKIKRDSGTITNADITDERTAELKRNSSSDFLPHEDSPASNYVIINAGTYYNYGHLYEKTSDVIRLNHRFQVTGDSGGEYDVRIRRTTADRSGSAQFDSIYWTALRGITHEQPIQTDFNVSLVEMRIKATNQLNGVLDQFNCIAHSQVLDWDSGSSTWIEQNSNNSASLFRHVLQFAGNKKAVANSQIDLSTLQDWHENNDLGYIFGTIFVNGAHTAPDSTIDLYADTDAIGELKSGALIRFENDSTVYTLTADSGVIDENNNQTISITPTLQYNLSGDEEVILISPSYAFNQYVDYQSSIDEILRLIASSGRAAPTFKDGKYSVIEDRPKSTVVQHFSPRNSWGFSGKRMFPELPHAWRVRFRNEDMGYQDDEVIVYQDGYNEDGSGGKEAATVFEGLELPGVTDYYNAVRLARFHIRTLILQQEGFIHNADVENIVCTRGDLVRFSHDVPSIGISSGRIKAVQVDGGGDATGVTMDEICTMESGKTYAIRFRKSDGTTLTASVVLNIGEQTTLTFTTPIPAANKPAVGDMGFFGETDEETLECLVKSIIPNNNLEAQLHLIPYAPTRFDVDSEDILDYSSMITAIPSMIAPVIDNVRSNEYVLYRGSDGSLQPQIVVTLAFVASLDLDKISHTEGQYRVSPQTGSDYKAGTYPWTNLPDIPKDTTEVSIKGVIEGEDYDLRFRYIYADGRIGSWTYELAHTVVGKTSNPPAPSSHSATAVIGGIRLQATCPDVPDLHSLGIWRNTSDSYPGGSADWVIPGKANEVIAFTDRTAIYGTIYYYFFKAYDTSGNASSETSSVNATPLQIATGDIDISDYPKLPWDEDLVGYWPLDDGSGTQAVDASGRGHNGTLVNSPSWVQGIVSGKAIDFESSSVQRIEILHHADIDFDKDDSFSLSIWCKPESLSSDIYLLAKIAASPEYEGYKLYIDSNGAINFLLVHDDSSNDYIHVKTGNSVISAGNVYHVVLTYDGSEAASGVSIYVNGNSETLSTQTDNLTGSTLNAYSLLIGVDYGAAGPFDGIIDQIRIYATEITQGEVIALYLIPSGNESTSQSMDALIDGTYGKVLSSGLSSGQVVLANAVGDLDDVSNGSTYGRVQLSILDSGYLFLMRKNSDATKYLQVTASGLEAYVNSVKLLELGAGVGYFGNQSAYHSKIYASGFEVKNGSTVLTSVGTAIRVGQETSGQSNVNITGTSIQMRENTFKTLDLEKASPGDLVSVESSTSITVYDGATGKTTMSSYTLCKEIRVGHGGTYDISIGYYVYQDGGLPAYTIYGHMRLCIATTQGGSGTPISGTDTGALTGTSVYTWEDIDIESGEYLQLECKYSFSPSNPGLPNSFQVAVAGSYGYFNLLSSNPFINIVTQDSDV